MRVTIPRTTLELAIAALKSLSASTHARAALERRLTAAVLRRQGDQLDAAAEEIRAAIRREDRDG